MTNLPGGFDSRGVVDLGALAQARQAQAKAKEQVAQELETGVPVPLAFHTGEATFTADVVERSYVVPVVIDFWATWCEPCKQLSPILEKLVAEYDGRWLLAKVDVDVEPKLAQAFSVQGIPALFAVVAGAPLPLFQGALPEPQVRQVLDQLLKVAEQEGVDGQLQGGVVPPGLDEIPEPEITDPELDDAADAIDRGELDVAIALYRQLLIRQPDHEDAKAGLATVLLMQRTAGIDLGEVLLTVAGDPDDVQAHLQAADALVLHARAGEGFDLLIDAFKRSADEDRDLIRTHLLSLFDLLGPEHPAVPVGRLALSNALF